MSLSPDGLDRAALAVSVGFLGETLHLYHLGGAVAVVMGIVPPKGLVLPFISYGGSSLLALALGMGMILALTRRRVGDGRIVEWPACARSSSRPAAPEVTSFRRRHWRRRCWHVVVAWR